MGFEDYKHSRPPDAFKGTTFNSCMGLLITEGAICQGPIKCHSSSTLTKKKKKKNTFLVHSQHVSSTHANEQWLKKLL